jgi:hypothetical protein
MGAGQIRKKGDAVGPAEGEGGFARFDRFICYLSIRINSSFDIPFHIATFESISFNVPGAISL